MDWVGLVIRLWIGRKWMREFYDGIEKERRRGCEVFIRYLVGIW